MAHYILRHTTDSRITGSHTLSWDGDTWRRRAEEARYPTRKDAEKDIPRALADWPASEAHVVEVEE